MAIEVGELSPVPLRSVWSHEAMDFTPWLAEQLPRLSKALGMELELEGVEVSVGPFSVDIVARDVGTGRRVAIENMLNQTDHGHVGQLVTYAAGLEASYAVLVAERFRPEHRTALTWLNELAESDTGFFGVEIKAVRIGDSSPAAVLDVVVRPDDWQRQVRDAAETELTPARQRNVDWWSAFLPALHETYPNWTSASTPSRDGWMNLPTGRGGVRYDISWSWTDHGYRLRVGLYIDDGDAHYDQIHEHRDAIDEAITTPVSWEPLPDAKASRVVTYLESIDPEDRDRWTEYRSWALDRLGEFRQVCQPVIDQLVA